jgi:hypothetical protein
MNYKRLKPEEKLRYVEGHSSDAKERLETAMQHMKWAMQDVKFLYHISTPETKLKHPAPAAETKPPHPASAPEAENKS